MAAFRLMILSQSSPTRTSGVYVLQGLDRRVVDHLGLDRYVVDSPCDRTDISLKASKIATPSAPFVPTKYMAVFYQADVPTHLP